MYAVVKLGSSQYKVTEGDKINAIRIKDEKGAKITLDKVLMYADGTDVRIGKPFLEDVKVSAEVVSHKLDKKVTAFKYRRRKDSSSIRGHRTKLTTLSITKIAA